MQISHQRLYYVYYMCLLYTRMVVSLSHTYTHTNTHTHSHKHTHTHTHRQTQTHSHLSMTCKRTCTAFPSHTHRLPVEAPSNQPHSVCTNQWSNLRRKHEPDFPSLVLATVP